MKVGSLFSGYGGLDMAVNAVLGRTTAWHCEIDPAATRILEHHHPHIPNHGDITKVNWSQVEPVHVLTAGYPCQPFSFAGKGLGETDVRYLWPEVVRAARAMGPRFIVLENVRGHLVRGFARVLGDLADIGYDARWAVVRASDAGAPHRRERLFVVATNTNRQGLEERGRVGGNTRQERQATLRGGVAAHPVHDGREGRQERDGRSESGSGVDTLERLHPDGRTLRGQYEPAIRRWEHVLGRPAPEPTEPGTRGNRRLNPVFVEWMMGLPAGWVTNVPGITRNDQLKALGNGVVPQQAALALHHLVPAMEVAA